MQIRNSPYNKEYNRRLIIRSLFREKLSRAELSRRTGLTRAAITILVDELINEGLIRESGILINNGVAGPRPKQLEIVPDRYYVICVDIARDCCSIGLVDFGGHVLVSRTVDIGGAASPQSAVELISEEIRKNILAKVADHEKLLGLGISTPGPVDTVNGITDNIPDFKIWRGFRIVDEFRKHFDMCVRLERDANAIALAELYFGFGRKYDDFMCIMSYIGIGFGVIKNRSLFSGKFGLTPELGHISINFNGEPCVCGNRGCLYQYYGLSLIIKNVQKIYPDVTGWEEIVDRAYGGEDYFINIIDHYARILSTAAVNAINLFAINKIVLSGFVTYKPSIFLESLSKYVRNAYITSNFFDVDIHVTEMTSHENLIGAAAGVIDAKMGLYD